MLLQEFLQLKYYCSDFQIQNSATLASTFGDFSIYIHDKISGGKFYYSITSPSLNANTHKGTVHVTFKPKNHVDPKEHSMLIEMAAAAHSLSNWLNLVNAYADISLDVNDRFLIQYEKDFYSDYEIVDDDANTAPFDDEKQKLVEYSLEAFEEAIEIVEMPAESKADILKQTTELKNRIPTLTKNQVVFGWSKISAKLKLQGRDIAKSVFEEAKKSLAKMLLEKGWQLAAEYVPKMIHHLLP